MSTERKVVAVYVSPVERDAFKMSAESNGYTSVSQYIRDVMLDQLSVEGIEVEEKNRLQPRGKYERPER